MKIIKRINETIIELSRIKFLFSYYTTFESSISIGNFQTLKNYIRYGTITKNSTIFEY